MPTLSQLAWATLLVSPITLAQNLAPSDDILPLNGASSTDPLQYIGGNSPWRPGPPVYGISNEVPKGCSVQQAVYLPRHGSRFPDSIGGYTSIQAKVAAAVQENNLTATGPFSFLPFWEFPVTNQNLQISQETLLGFKELHDLGFQLRARYPHFYEDGNPFYVWANAYSSPASKSRVLQSAQAFVQGYLYVFAQAFGTVISVNSTGSVDATGNSLGPSDLCPNFQNSPGNNVTDFDNTWVPAAVTRINSMVSGNFSFTAADILNIPGLCGYESMIVGRLSPWCSIFNDEENKNYEYSQDLQYYYGPGPGSAKPNQQLFYPFLQGLLDLLMEGPGQQGVAANGSAFTVPNLIMGFWNDNQIAEFTAAMGLFDDQEPLPLDHIPDGYIYNIANIIPMRGTVTFEVLNCEGSAPPPSSSATAGNGGSTSTSSSKGSATVSNPSSTGPPSSSLGSVSSSSIIGSETTTSGSVKTSTVTVTTTASDCVPTTAFPTSYFKRSLPQQPNTNSTYLRILLNDAVYVIPSCQNGPGNSCLLSQYAAVIHDKYSAAGTFNEFCNVTTDAPNNANGATFFTNLTLNYLTPLSPFSDTF